MSKKILTYPDERLKKRASEVRGVDEVGELIEQMKKTLKEVDGVGLAAPQVGISKQVFVVKDGHGYYGFMNPKIIEKSKETITTKEGCLSFPEMWIDVERPKKIKVEALMETGERMVLEAEGTGAVVFQHEIDHLYGNLLIDKLSGFERIKNEIRYKAK